MISRSRKKHRITAANRLAILRAINGRRIAGLFLGAALAVAPLATSFAQDAAPRELPITIHAQPVARTKLSEPRDNGNQISFGAVTKSKAPKAVRSVGAPSRDVQAADAEVTEQDIASQEAADQEQESRVVHAVAKGSSKRGTIRRVAAADGDAATASTPTKWNASRSRSVLVNSPQEQEEQKDLPSAPVAPKTNATTQTKKPTTGLRADCGAEKQACEDARMKVFANTIDKIKIDISPLLFSDEDSKSLDAMIEASEKLTLEGMKESPFRTWTDRHGNVLVQNARLLRVRANTIIVVDAAGATQSIRIADLSEGDLCEAGDVWGIPVRCRLHEELYVGRSFCPTTLTWTASALCHKPNYFEQIELERYGHTPGPILEAPLAGAKFAADIVTLPYKVGINPPNECRYALGYYRPGNCAPWIVPPVPLSLRGAIFQTAAVTGVSWIIP